MLARADGRLSTGASLCAALLTLLALAAGARAVTISPLPGTPDASPHTQISFLGVPAGEIHDVSVVGSLSGSHSGHLRSYESAPGASFIPAEGFVEGENVSVSALTGRAGHEQRVGSSFTVAQLAHPHLVPMSSRVPPVKPGAVQRFASQPKLEPPAVSVITSAPTASTADVFVAANGSIPQRGPMIFDRSGQLVWFKAIAPAKAAMDLQVERYRGQPVLVWWQGYIGLGVGFGQDEIYGQNYKPIASLSAGNGYSADLHDIQLTPSGSAFITAYTLVEADLSSVGGAGRATLQDALVQEIDVPTGLVMFEWHAEGHVALSDSYWSHPSSTTSPWDWFHVNSISLDPWGDGNFLISSRNTWAGYEISHTTGRVLWRLGGRHPSFKMGSGTSTAWQHDIRWQADHTLTVFDNGDSPKVHPQTRVVHERIDWPHRAVDLISEAVHTPSLLANSQGNDQLLPGGSSFVGWGNLPYVSEFSPSGQLVFDARLAAPGASYRAFTYPWNGTPAGSPALAVHPGAGQALTAYVSWNGATDVSSWELLAGPDPNQLAAVETVPRTGFETAIAADSAQPYLAVAAIDAAGKPLATSAAVRR